MKTDEEIIAIESTDNVSCYKIGLACRETADSSSEVGDEIDRGLILMKRLHAKGFKIVKLKEG